MRRKADCALERHKPCAAFEKAIRRLFVGATRATMKLVLVLSELVENIQRMPKEAFPSREAIGRHESAFGSLPISAAIF